MKDRDREHLVRDGVGGRGRGALGRGSRLRGADARILAKDRPLELLQRRAWIDAELVEKSPSTVPIDLECLSLTTRSVEREHELAAETLSKRVLLYQRLQLARQLVVAVECEVGVDAVLDGGKPDFHKPPDHGLGEGLVREVRERRAAPERKSRAKPVGGIDGIAGGKSTASLLDETLEPEEIDRVEFHARLVAS